MFIIEVPYLNLDKTYNSGQCLRWFKIHAGKYVAYYKNKSALIEQNRQKLIINSTEEEFLNTWYGYFDIQKPYNEMFESYNSCSCKGLRKMSDKSLGLRIINQDLWEVIVASIISAKNPNDTKFIMDGIARSISEPIKQSYTGYGQRTWYSFPNPQMMLEKIEIINNNYIGPRKQLLIDVIEDFCNGWLNLEEISICKNKEEVIEKFNERLSESIIDKICLYGLNIDVFPKGIQIDKIIRRKNPLLNASKIEDIISTNDKIHKGLTYQMFIYENLKKQKDGIYGINR